ncbi:MAG: ribonuclease III [Deltaproteobacteria bacterium]|jgi:ribonuclease-3|nr:ribonuclease III [Deltaproteobacteria bacterium]
MADKGLELARLERALGYVFQDAGLLAAAVTHSSFANETDGGGTHNERLEFLGDAVLSLCISSELFARFPDAREGDLTRVRSQLVNAVFLADLARAIGLDDHLRLGRGEENQGGRARDVLLGDALEAVLGAVYEDGGVAPVRELVRRLFAGRWPRTLSREFRKDFKTQLQEIIQQKYRERPTYTLNASHGPEHAKLFEVCARLPDGRIFVALGPSLKRAEQEAARIALLALHATPE